MKKIKNIDIKCFLIILSIVMLFLGYLINDHYAVDTYATMLLSHKSHALHYLNSGRIVMSFFIFVIYIFNISYRMSKIISFIIAVLSITSAIYFLMEHLKEKYNKKKLLAALLSIAVILNPFVLELFLFPEFTGVMCIGILSSVLASIFLDNFITKRNKKDLLLSILFVTIAACSYQGVLSIYIALTSIFIIVNNKSFKDFIINNIFMGIPYAIAIIVNFIISMFGPKLRATSPSDIFGTISTILNEFKNLMLTSGNLLPKYVLITSIIITTIIVILNIIEHKKYKYLLGLIYLIFFVVIFSILPQIMADAVWIPPRTVYAIGALPALIFLYNYLITKSSNKYYSFITILLLILFSIQYFQFQQVILSKFITNELDSYETKTILYYIEDYEQKNNTVINEVVLYNDKYIKYTYEDIINYKDYNLRGYAANFSAIALLNIHSNNKFTKITNDDKYLEYCSNNDFSNISNDIFNFDNNRVYICIY